MKAKADIIKSYETLRFLAISVIFINHYWQGFQWLIMLTTLGVELFFMMSGFLFYTNHHTDRGPIMTLTRHMLCKRLARLYPLCLLTLPFGWKYIEPASPLGAITDLTLTQSWFPIDDIYFSGNAALWFVSSLLFCWAVSYPVIRLMKRRPAISTALGLVYFIAYCMVASVVSEDKFNAIIYINPLMQFPAYLTGMILGKLYLTPYPDTPSNKTATVLTVSALAVAALFFMMSDTISLRFTIAPYWWFPAAVLLYTFARVDRSRSVIADLFRIEPLVKLGRYAMAVYIIHLPIIAIYYRALLRLGIDSHAPIAIVTCYIITFCLAVLAEHLIVGPVSRRLCAK